MSQNVTGRAVPASIGDVVTISVNEAEELVLEVIPRVHALTDFDVYGVAADADTEWRIPLAVAGGGFTSPVWPVRRASGDLSALAQDTLGYMFISVKGLSQVILRAAGLAGTLLDVKAGLQ